VVIVVIIIIQTKEREVMLDIVMFMFCTTVLVVETTTLLNRRDIMFILKTGEFYYVGYDEITSDEIYSSGKAMAMSFKTLEELDEYVEEYNLRGYAVAK
jgi:hypothetical protein